MVGGLYGGLPCRVVKKEVGGQARVRSLLVDPANGVYVRKRIVFPAVTTFPNSYWVVSFQRHFLKLEIRKWNIASTLRATEQTSETGLPVGLGMPWTLRYPLVRYCPFTSMLFWQECLSTLEKMISENRILHISQTGALSTEHKDIPAYKLTQDGNIHIRRTWRRLAGLWASYSFLEFLKTVSFNVKNNTYIDIIISPVKT